MGENPNSELESQNTFNFFKTAAPVIGSIDWHSYGQLILRPYGWTDANSPHEAQLKSIGDGIRDEILDVHDVQYTSQKSIALYVTTGYVFFFFLKLGRPAKILLKNPAPHPTFTMTTSPPPPTAATALLASPSSSAMRAGMWKKWMY